MAVEPRRQPRVSPSVLAAGSITCGVCGADFTPDQVEQDNGELCRDAYGSDAEDQP